MDSDSQIPRDKTQANVSHEEDETSSLNSYDAQTGVKGIEAISQIWTKWSLIFAYVGYVV